LEEMSKDKLLSEVAKLQAGRLQKLTDLWKPSGSVRGHGSFGEILA